MKKICMRRSIIQTVCWISILWVSFFLISLTAYAGLRDGLIAHYPFDGGPVDAGQNQYTGIEKNGVLLTDDRFGKPDSAYQFDGEDDYIAVEKFQFPQVFSLSMWINPQDTTDGRMFLGKQSAVSSPSLSIGFSNGGYSVRIGTSAYSKGVKTKDWQHLAIVVEKDGADYSRVLFYKNSRLLWSKNHFDPIENSVSLAIAIGAAWEGAFPISFFSGKMDEIRIYDRALSQTEIELLYNPIQGLDITWDDDIDGEDFYFFSKSIGQKRWYKDFDGDGYSDGSSRWSKNRPDTEYYRKADLKGIFGDCDDSNPEINPDVTGTQCPPFGACCYTLKENCIPVTRCDDNVSERVCITELNGIFYKDTQCLDLTPDECPVNNGLGACCQTMVSNDGTTSAVCNDNVGSTECADSGGSFFANRQCAALTAEECPVPAPVGSCCHPKISYVNESGVFPVQCLDSLTEYKCDLLQGTWSESHSCDDLTEAQCSPYGACCYDDNGTAKCASGMLKSNCTKLSGTFFADRQCGELTSEQCPAMAPPSTGACCLTTTVTDGSSLPVRCIDARTQAQCSVLGGSWFEDQACEDLTYEQCPALTQITGACCQTMVSNDGTTSAVCNDNVGSTECADSGGSFFANRQCAA
ncbi:LamG domain-containing protein, partial [Desulfobacter latus]